ncbi:predicted protein [Pyrenophora tritici-repentis Pt-1C-BFP]|uniref:Uncharacterized protein n=1 Tax=Pyrenophora tritici-repentis (strain Pt-1C-BFP) TaxID=426418 RepID=B2WQ28_PYRTR|nr:uncharacterized protein PTRG_12096 [Pyrenophora tritici-repentis Pt-1C-BFP]EDU46244.1 predicted protein [Pyrenophora tritici-repentis Pt-1C-BFP]
MVGYSGRLFRLTGWSAFSAGLGRPIKESLQTAVSSIHISSDLWSSPNRYSLLGITAHISKGYFMLRAFPLMQSNGVFAV